MRKIAITSAGSLPASRQPVITPRATMSTRVLETTFIITAIFSTPGLPSSSLRQVPRLRDARVAADLAVVGGLPAVLAHRVEERERAAAGADHEAEVRRRTRRRCRRCRGGRPRSCARPRARTASAGAPGASRPRRCRARRAAPCACRAPRPPCRRGRRARGSCRSSSFASGLISASVRSKSRKSCISWNTIGVSRTRSSPRDADRARSPPSRCAA